jgi:hypothetical protein
VVTQKSFLVFLPQDEASADPVAEEVVTLIAAGLDSLLRLSDIQFRETCADASLLACIDSYLQNCRYANFKLQQILAWAH